MNARLVSATANSAIFAWTTNEAADSLALVKKGLDILGEASDPTFELEHLLTVTGLTPDTDYFVTLVSRDPSTNVASQNTTFGTLKEGAATGSPLTGGGASPVGGIIIGGESLTGGNGSSFGGFDVAWKPKSSVEPDGGYRIDIFDENWVLVEQKNIPAGTHETRFDNLLPGNYHVVVYESKSGTLEKVSAPAPVTVKVSWLERVSVYSSFFAFVFVLLGAMLISLFLIEKKRRAGLAAAKVSQ